MTQNEITVAAIDVGTSRIKFAVKRFDEQCAESVLALAKTRVHLGDDIAQSGAFSTQTIEDICKILHRYLKIAKDHNTCTLRCVATEAFRSAKNASEAIGYIRQKTGIELDILSQHKEAVLFFRAVSEDFPNETIAVVDVGGGSVQITIGKDKNVSQSYLLKTGTVFLKNTFIRSPKPNWSEVVAIQKHIDDALLGCKIRKVRTTRLIYGTTNVIDFLEAMSVDLISSSDTKKSSSRNNRFYYPKDLRMLCNRILETPYKQRAALYPKEPFFMYGADLALLNVLSICNAFNIEKIHPTNDNTLSAILRELAENKCTSFNDVNT